MTIKTKTEATSLGITYHLQPHTNTLKRKHNLEGGVRKAISRLIKLSS